MTQSPQNLKSSVISATTLQRQAGSVIRRVAVDREHLVVERDGFPMMAILPIADYQALLKLRSNKKQPK